MEVRLNKHGPDSLATKVFFSDESGFEVASVIVTGKTDAVLIDAQWTLSNAHRVVAEILETGKHLKTIYVTHAHPDHYFGLGPIADAFPKTRVIALPGQCWAQLGRAPSVLRSLQSVHFTGSPFSPSISITLKGQAVRQAPQPVHNSPRIWTDPSVSV